MTTWLGVWTRAVIGPAMKRALGVWAGAALVAAVIFGPNGMHPRTLTMLMRTSVGATIVLGGTWLLLFVPIARVIVQADGARYLWSLPHARGPLTGVRVLALVGLQLPWIVLWAAGEGVRGLAAVVLSAALAAAIGAWRPRGRVRRAPAWRSDLAAFRATYLSALTRRASEALVRGAGLAVLAGLAGGWFVRVNHLAGADAARLAAILVVIASLPATVGVLSPLRDAHRSSTWLAQSLGVSSSRRTFALASALLVVHALASVIALAALMLVLVTADPAAMSGSSPPLGRPVVDAGAAFVTTALAITGAILACALAAALGTTRVILGALADEQPATRMVIGAFAVAVVTAILVAVLDAPLGPLAAVLACATWLGLRSERT